jgi:signal transduction histidine kinase/ActR/RegA family two-component response regulator
MKILSFRAQLDRNWRAFGLGAVLFVSVSVVALGSLVLYQHDVDERVQDSVEQSYVLRADMQGAFSLLQDIEVGDRGFVITGDTLFLEPYTRAKGKLPAQMALLRQGAAAAREQAYFGRLEPLVRQKLRDANDIVLRRRLGGAQDETLLHGVARGKMTMDAIRAVLGQWQDHERDRLAARIAAAKASSQSLTVALAGLSAAVCALLLMAGGAAAMALRDSARVAAELAASRDEARAATQAKSAFLTMMSHELRTPLNGVLGMVHALTRTNLNARQRAHLDVIDSSGRSLLLILNDILDLSKIEAGRLEVETVPFGLTRLLENVVALWGPPAAEKGLTLTLDLDPSIPAWAAGDPTRLRQVVTNLLSNAMKFTDQGSICLRVRAADSGLLVIEVIDTGAGIPDAVQARLFTDFSQADSSTSRRFGGTGLGLSISRRLCRLMGGDLVVSSVEGMGSTFRASVMLGAAEPNAVAIEPESIDLPSLRVLAVDDNAANRAVAEALLSAIGLSVTLANDGAQALEVLKRQAVDLVLMDVNMPVMGGVEALRAIRRGEAGDPDIPIIAVTADAMLGDRERYLAEGFDDHLAKPIEPTALIQMLFAAKRSGPSSPATAMPESATG